MIYLGQPYSHPHAKVREARYKAGLEWCARLQSRIPYSPIVHWHNVAKSHSLPTDADYWLEHCYHILGLSKALFVLQLDGWEKSYGLAKEIEYAARTGLTIAAVDIATTHIIYVHPTTLLGRMRHGKDHIQRKPDLRAVDEHDDGSG